MHFDLVIVGSGPGGYKAALTAAHLGARVALIERGRPGGCCLNQGCVPKKALVHIACLIEDIHSLQGRGLDGGTRGDFLAALAHKDSVVDGIHGNFPLGLRRLGISFISGHARLAGRAGEDYRIEVTDGAQTQTLTAPRVILAVGAAPREHPIARTDGERILHSGHFMHGFTTRPESVLFVGGGTVGVELGFLMRQFGSAVTIVDTAERLLENPALPERASEALARKFARLEIAVRTETSVAACDYTVDGVRVRLTDGTEGEFSRVIVAIGREPVTHGLGLDSVGIDLDANGFIATNEFLETSARGVYAVGDTKPGPMTANAALHDAKIAATNAIQGNQARPNYNQVPLVIDSALEIAAVGLSEERAEAAGFSAEVARTNFGSSAKARGRHDFEGFIEVVHDGETGQLLGGCIVGPEAGEQIHLLAAACQSERGLWFFTDMNYSHPSWTEELENAIDPYTAAFARSGKTVFRPGIYSRKPPLP